MKKYIILAASLLFLIFTCQAQNKDPDCPPYVDGVYGVDVWGMEGCFISSDTLSRNEKYLIDKRSGNKIFYLKVYECERRYQDTILWSLSNTWLTVRCTYKYSLDKRKLISVKRQILNWVAEK